MKILTGNKINEISSIEFNNIIKGYRSLVIDIGTGEGEFIYKKARQNHDIMYIGLDASADPMWQYSAKSTKKPEKGGLRNVLYIVGNANDLPDELSCTADKIYVNLPWGSLRDGIIKGEHDFLVGIRKISKANAFLEIYVSYCDLYEKQEIENRQLPELTTSYFNNDLKENYNKNGLRITKVSVLDNEGLKKLDTKWAKKLAFGKKREVFCINCIVKK